MGLNPKQVKLLKNFFPIPSNPCVLGITEQGLGGMQIHITPGGESLRWHARNELTVEQTLLFFVSIFFIFFIQVNICDHLSLSV
jgi:hypothetical protein